MTWIFCSLHPSAIRQKLFFRVFSEAPLLIRDRYFYIFIVVLCVRVAFRSVEGKKNQTHNLVSFSPFVKMRYH